MLKFTITVLSILFSVQTHAGGGVYPEDGSARLSKWYYGKSAWISSEFLAAAQKESLYLAEFPSRYRYLQDITVWKDDGTLLLMAKMPADPVILGTSLTMGVLNDEDDSYQLRYVSENTAKYEAKVKTEQMDWTFFEGGDAISGRLKDGSNYIIFNQNVIDRAINFYRHKTNKVIDEETAKNLMSKDLGVPAKNIFIVIAGGHLDLRMQALPGGTILLDDPRLVRKVIENILRHNNLPSKERETLEIMLSYYKHGRKLRPWSETATMPYSDFDLNQLDEIEKVLKKRFNVIRVPGTFDKNINFFNGFAGKNPDNKTFIMTNKAPDLKSLEDYWTSLLVKYGINENNIHFVGDYIPGAGIDCSGAPAGN